MTEQSAEPAAVRVAVVTSAPLPARLLDEVRGVSARVDVRVCVAQTADGLDGLWAGIEALYTDGLLPAPGQALALRWVQGSFAGVERFRDNPLFETVTLTNASGIHGPAIAEYTLMMMLAFAHRLPLMMEYQRRGEWSRDRWPGFNAQELRGATAGIVGYGSIGREVGRLARAFGMRVLALKRDRARTADTGWRLPGVGDPALEYVDRLLDRAELPVLLGESDYVVLAAPLTAETRGMIGAPELAQMKRGAVLINVARGGLLDEGALIAALEEGRLGGAALDVFSQEPLPAESPLWRLPNALLSPHISDVNAHYDVRAIGLFAENLRRYLGGQPLLNVVDVAQGY